MEFGNELMKGTITPIVLALLKERPMYGYEIVKLVDARSGGKLRWKEGTLYPALHKLESDGLIRGEWRETPGATVGGRRRKYYALTRSGRSELARRMGEWKEFSTSINAVLKGALS